ncbi:AraC family transcriptional regulator [Cohnella sp. WQ 127256]|uniref:helix-turn-helix domain-containing protein n=1 Tax=Cohnella sp. WQ 127256 TaxID=2938790 RepID=UPI0021198958|nr:AraC family transcriptional regulator [Cohnella sp. WQ 127256]
MFQHANLELTMILEGRGLFRWGSEEHTVETGQVVLIPANIPHSFHAVTPIRFGVLLMEGLPPEPQAMFDCLIPESHPKVITLSRMDQEQFELLFHQWMRMASSNLKDPQKSYSAWIQVILLFLYEHFQTGRMALSVTHVADYIRKHLRESLLISDLAERAALSEEGFRKRFYGVYGMTPKQYQQNCRLSEAKWLLSSTNKDIQTIAESIGFVQQHSFSSWFKKLECYSPSEWRKQQRLFHD